MEHLLWRNAGRTEVELVTIDGGGHGLPQPYARRPRLLGPSPIHRRAFGKVRMMVEQMELDLQADGDLVLEETLA